MKRIEPLTKHTLHLREGDMDRLKSLYPEVGAAYVIRKLVSNFLDRDNKEGQVAVMKELEL